MRNISIKSEKGVTAIEYGLLAGAIGLAIITVLAVVGGNTKQTFCKVASSIGGTDCKSETSQPVVKYTSSNSNTASGGSQLVSLFYSSSIFFGQNAVISDQLASDTGIYDMYGNALSTAKDLQNYFGISQSDMDNFLNASSQRDKAEQAWANSGYPSSGAIYNTFQTAGSLANQATNTISNDIDNSGNILYIPDQTKVTLTNSAGDVKTYSSSGQIEYAGEQYDNTYSDSIGDTTTFTFVSPK